MAQTTMQRQLSKNCTQCSRVRSNRLRCQASSSRVDVASSLKLAPAVLAAVLAANTGAMCLDLVAPRPVLADTEEENLTPYERRQREVERRRELLRQARERALEKATTVEQQQAAAIEQATQAVVSANESRSSEVSKLSSELKSSADLYQSATSKSKLQANPSPATSAPWWQSKEEATPAPEPPKPAPVIPTPAPAPVISTPAPAPVTPAPAPAATEAPWWESVSKPEPVKAPEPQAAVTKAPEPKPAPKPAPAPEQKPGKRQGPLPGWLAELLVLGALGGLAVAYTRYLDETNALVGKYTKELEKSLLNLKMPTIGGN